MLRSMLIAVGIAVATGKQVHIVDDRCPDDCEFKTWTTTSTTKLRASPDEASAVVTELARGEQVQGLAARTITSYLPLCTFVVDDEGHRADCVKPDCERVKFRSGDEFFYREHRGLSSLIEYRDSEFVIQNRFDLVKDPSGRYEGVMNYKCNGGPVFKTWVQVKLPNGTRGWADRKNFDGTVKWAGTIGGRPAEGGMLGGLPGKAGGRACREGGMARRGRLGQPLFFVDTATVVRWGTNVAFRMDQHSTLPLSTRTGNELSQVDADCASRSWKSKSSFPYRQDDGKDVMVEDTVTLVPKAGTVYDAVMTAACTGAFKSGVVADLSRYAAAYFGASGSVRERLDAAARAQDGSSPAAEPKQ